MATVSEAERRKLIKLFKNQTDAATWRRFVLGIFVFACLNVTAQPCLMAMESAPVTEIAADHSPSGAHHDHSTHHDDDSVQSGCDHCPTSSGTLNKPCVSNTVSGCETVSTIGLDVRQFKSKLKDLSQLAVLPAVPLEKEYSPDIVLLPPPGVDLIRHTGDPSLNIRYCVFLI